MLKVWFKYILISPVALLGEHSNMLKGYGRKNLDRMADGRTDAHWTKDSFSFSELEIKYCVNVFS